ncbi:MAG: MFS transporter [Acholeplasmataceae bacterium]|nr:MFS transporter [Acholeplasmataceae bacterium]
MKELGTPMDARTTYIRLSVMISFAFMLTTLAEGLYWIETAKLEPYQLILLGTALEVSILLFEIPTGVFADRKGRKISVSTGLFIVTAGFFIQAVSLSFLWLMIAQVIWGFGYTFISGALDAWVSDETANEGIQRTYLTAVKRTRFFGVIATIEAILIGVYTSYRSAMLAGVLIFFLSALYSVIAMKETTRPIRHTHHPVASLFSGFKAIKGARLLIFMALAAFLLGLHSESIDRLDYYMILDRYMLQSLEGYPVIIQIGLLQIVFLVFSYLVTAIMDKYSESIRKPLRLLCGLTLMMTIGIIMFTWSQIAIMGVLGIVFYRMFRAGLEPLYNAVIAKEVKSGEKATVMSTFAQIDSIGQLFSGALMATTSVLLEVQATLVLAAVILTLAGVVFYLSFKKAAALS